MAYAIIYRVRFKNDKNHLIKVDICDESTYTTDPITPTVFNLTPAENPFKVISVDNERVKFKSIRGKQAEINFQPTFSTMIGGYINAMTFVGVEDNRWRVIAEVEATGFNLFTGFLVMDDHQQPFLPASHKRTITLTATDNLGILSEVPLTDADGLYIRGKNTILSYVLNALRKTNLGLNVVITTTWFEEHQTDFECPWQFVYLDGKTFEDSIGEAVDCYRVLEIIFGYDCELSQYNGKWWISHIDEKTGNDIWRYEYTAAGVHVADYTPESFNQVIGKDEYIKWIGKDAVVSYTRPHKFTKLTFNYRFPIEIIDNLDFSRGLDDLVPIVVDMSPYISVHANLGSFPSTGQYELTYKATDTGKFYKWVSGSYVEITSAEIPTGIAYVWEDWEVVKVAGGTPEITAYISKIYENGAEVARYAVLPGSTSLHYVQSNPLGVNRFDKFTFSFDRRKLQNVEVTGPGSGTATATENVAQVRLYGNNGTYWTVQGDTGDWISCNSSFTTAQQYIKAQYNINQTDETQWMNLSVDARPLPVGGEIRVVFQNIDDFVYQHFANLQFDLVPFVNGSYQKYTGHSHTVSQDGNYKSNIEEEVFLSDGMHPAHKGVMFYNDGTGFQLTKRWYAAGDMINQGIAIPPPVEYLHPFGFLQIFALWNQHNRTFVSIGGSLKGLVLDGDVPDQPHVFSLNAPSMQINHTNKRFILTNREINPDSEEWRGELIETYDTTIDRVYDDDYAFKYEQQ